MWAQNYADRNQYPRCSDMGRQRPQWRARFLPASYLKTNRRGSEPIPHIANVRSCGEDPQSGTKAARAELQRSPSA